MLGFYCGSRGKHASIVISDGDAEKLQCVSALVAVKGMRPPRTLCCASEGATGRFNHTTGEAISVYFRESVCPMLSLSSEVYGALHDNL